MKMLKSAVALVAALSLASGAMALSACGDSKTRTLIKDAHSATQAAVEEGTYTALTFSADYSTTSSGETITGGSYSEGYSVKGAADIKNAAFDVEIARNWTVSAGQTATEYGYYFMRGQYLFAPSDIPFEQAQTDFAGKSFMYTSLTDIGTDQTLVALISAIPYVGADPSAAFALASIAEDYHAASTEGKTITLDFVKAAEGMWNAVDELVNSFDDKTTVLDVYDSTIVQNIFAALEFVVGAEDIAPTVAAITAMLGVTLPVTLPEAEEGQSLYDYVEGILTDEDFAKQLGMDKAIGETLLADIVASSGGTGGDGTDGTTEAVTIDSIVDDFNENKGVISFKDGAMTIKDTPQSEDYVLRLSKMSISLKLGDNDALTGLAVDFAAAAPSYGVTTQTTLSASMTYGPATLKDIGGGVVDVGGGSTMTIEELLANGDIGQNPGDNPSDDPVVNPGVIP